jgi:hypothetical protein
VLGGGFAYALADYLNGKWVGMLGVDKVLYLGWSLIGCSGLGFGFIGLFGQYTFTTVLPPMLLLYFGPPFIWPNAFAKAFSPFDDMVGYSAALYGFMQTQKLH